MSFPSFGRPGSSITRSRAEINAVGEETLPVGSPGRRIDSDPSLEKNLIPVLRRLFLLLLWMTIVDGKDLVGRSRSLCWQSQRERPHKWGLQKK